MESELAIQYSIAPHMHKVSFPNCAQVRFNVLSQLKLNCPETDYSLMKTFVAFFTLAAFSTIPLAKPTILQGKNATW